MRLDRTRIAIRERSLLDILDLSLRVIAAYPGPLLLTTMLCVVPLMLLNEWLIGWMPLDGDDPEYLIRYLSTMAILVFIEAPLASLLMTPYLGQAMFLEQPKPLEIARSLRKTWPSLVWCQLTIRGVIVAWLLAGGIPEDGDYSPQEGWLIVLTVFVALTRSVRPFINEIVLLEKTPLRAQGDYQMTVRRRSSVLHNPHAGDLFSRWLVSAAVAIALCVGLAFAIWYAAGMLLFDWSWGWPMIHIWIPLSLWLVAAYFSVVRFLSYLDLRIRREGWEVELVIRAAAAQLTEQAP